MVRLDPMTSQEYDAFLARSVPGYAEANVATGEWSAAEAPARAQAEFDRLLPLGRTTPDHFLFTIRSDSGTERVGDLWFAIQRPPRPPGGFVYDVFIDPAHRRHGYAEAAFVALETFARARGLSEIGLHVFGTNHPAITLYRKLGYETQHLLLVKHLDRPRSPEG